MNVSRKSRHAPFDVAEVDAEDLLARTEVADHVEDLFAGFSSCSDTVPWQKFRP
jgi:hypothetical protein